MKTIVSALALLASVFPASAGIITVEETNLGDDTAAVIANNFGEDSITFSDRVHQHNGAAFEADVLGNAGSTIINLPAYLIGNDYVQFANDARENVDYSAVVTTDVPSEFYLLIDNRINGPAGNTSSPNTSDPDLGGTLQWVIDGGWERVNTGISPAGQADYTGIDEGGSATGPGLGVDQFYSVYKLPDTALSVTVSNNEVGGSNMISLLAVPATDPDSPITSFFPLPITIDEGGTADLNWIIHSGATVASIDNGTGDILPVTTDGIGTAPVTPAVTTTYTLSVESPGGNETAEATVAVRLISDFSADITSSDPGDPITLSWIARNDATVTLSAVGAVAAGASSVVVNPVETTIYTLSATAGAESEMAQVRVAVQIVGIPYALLDLGATGGTPESGALADAQIGAGISGTNGTNLAPTSLSSETGDDFTLTIDSIDPDGVAAGGLDWRDRGTGNGEELTLLGEDLFKNNDGMIRVTLGGLDPGIYQVTSFHFDPTFSQSEAIVVSVTDANGVAADTGAVGSAFANPTVTAEDNTTLNMEAHSALFSIESNGADDVIIYFDGRGAVDEEVPLNGLRITSTGTGEEARIVRIDIDEMADTVTIEFTSQQNRSYSVFASTDLTNFDDEQVDSVEGQAGTTTVILPGIGIAGLEREFYRVVELPPQQ